MSFAVVSVADIGVSYKIPVFEPSGFIRLKVFYIVRFHNLLLIIIYILWTVSAEPYTLRPVFHTHRIISYLLKLCYNPLVNY